jgi:ribonuclease HI
VHDEVLAAEPEPMPSPRFSSLGEGLGEHRQSTVENEWQRGQKDGTAASTATAAQAPSPVHDEVPAAEPEPMPSPRFPSLGEELGEHRQATMENEWQREQKDGMAASTATAAQAPSPVHDEVPAAEPEPTPSPIFSSLGEWPGEHRQATVENEWQRGQNGIVVARVGRRAGRRWEQRRQIEMLVFSTDGFWWRQRRLRWYISARAWKRLMRSLRGNTVENTFTIALWNAREFHADASHARETSRIKMHWIRKRLEEERPDVCFLLEMMGDASAFTADRDGLRAWAQKIGYVARWIIGEGGSGREKRQGDDTYTNGIAVLVNQATCFIERHMRIEERVLGAWLRGRNEKEQIRLRVAAIHGLHHEGTSSFCKQVRAIREWSADTSQGSKGCVVVGDFNYVASEAWRSSRAALSANDVLFQDLLAQPNTEYVEPYAGKTVIVWTRKGGETTEGGDADGVGSMLDGAVAMGDECGHWRRAIVEFAFEHGAPMLGTKTKPLSDHAWLIFSRRIPALELRGASRPRAALPRADEKVKTAFRDRVRQGDIHEGICIARNTSAHATTEATRLLREAAVQVVAEARRGRAEQPLQTAHLWRRWLQEAYSARHAGLSPHEVRGGLFNWHSRLWLIRDRYAAAGDDVCWAKIITRCRRNWNRANQRLRRKQQRDDARLRELSLRIIEGKGSRDLARVAMQAWNAIRPPRASLAFDKFHPGDDTNSTPVMASETPDDFLSGLAAEGERLVRGFASTPPILEAFKAFCAVFCPTFETLRGRDGGEWKLFKELTFPVFLQVLKRVPRGKAVGHGGFSIELLINADRGVKEAFYECLMADLRGEVFPESWRRVIYVLLTKPLPNNPALISERREIALMAQDMKLVMHMVRATAYRLITGRLLPEQCGWLPGYGTVDAGLPLAAVIQQAQRLRQSIWILYVDLATFFPRIDREALRVAEVLVGLPTEVIDLVGKIYGAGRAVAAEAVECQFDTAIGLSATFKNHMGALMGEVLSPDRAKILLNSILWAIRLHVHGVALFGFGEDEDGLIRAIASLAYADDWAGTFSSETDLRRAWSIWNVWVPISGSKLGIKNKLKTVVTGVLRDEGGAERDIPDPNLITLDGVRVPVLSMGDAYKHLGVLRAALGGDAAAAESLQKQLRLAIGRVARMHRPSREDMVLVTNGLFQGLAGFKCSTVYYSFEWMEGVEREWRKMFNRKARRDSSTPVCLLYEGGGGTETATRRHLWAIGCSAFYSAFTRALADRADTSQRAAARSALALSLSRWGIQGDPRLASWRHLSGALERQLRDGRGYLGDTFMFISDLIRDEHEACGTHENWLWAVDPDTWDPLHAERPHFRKLESIALFDTEKSGGLGIDPAPRLLDARIRAAGQMATWGNEHEGPRWLSFDEARRVYPWLSTKARGEWERTVASLEERLEEAVTPEREAMRSWNQRGLLCGDNGRVGLSSTNTKSTATNEDSERELHGAIRSTLEAMKGGREQETVDWHSLLRKTFQGVKVPEAEVWCVGGGDARADAEGGRVFLELDSEEEPRGGEASWLQRSDIDDQGFCEGWMERAGAMRATYDFDEEGYLCHRRGGRLGSEQLGPLDPAVQIAARARLALGDVQVCRGDGGKRLETHVQLCSQRALWERLTTWSARVRATRIYTLDGGWRDVQVDNGRVKIATRAAVDHEGHVLGGRILEKGVKEDNYIAELAAQLDALTDAIARGPEERVIIVFDATSPVRAMLKFGRLGARARGDRLAAELLEHFERLRRRVAVLVLLWQTSHVGEPLNEWADVMCDKFGLDDDYPIPRGRVEFASLTFPAHIRSAQEYGMRGMSRVVAARLRSRVTETVLRSDEEHVQLLGISAEAQQICDEVAARRCQYVDQPYAEVRLSRLRSAEWCPFGCVSSAHGWREIHPSAAATRDRVSCSRLAQRLLAHFGNKFGEKEVVISSHEEEALGGSDIRAGSAIWAGGRWFARSECSPTWWHFQFECTGEPLLAARKAYALKATEARRRMVELQTEKELVPHSQLDDLILLIHQGTQGWVAEDGAGGSAAQREYVRNRVRRGEQDAWETEHWRAAAAGRVRVSGSRADSSSRWRLALTEMTLSGCRLQQLGKEHCKDKRGAFWERLRELRLLSKVFGAFRRSLLGAGVDRLAALRALRLACGHVEEIDGMDGYARRRLRSAVGTSQLEIGEGQLLTAHQPGVWLLSRVWVAWRTVLAQGGGKSGRHVLQGTRRDPLRERLFQAAFRETREFWVPGTQLADLQEARVRVWRRWLRVGGWGAFRTCSSRLDRARRSRALAAQREGMRRWAARANGCCWHILTDEEVEERFELAHEGLRRLLTVKQILSVAEWNRLGIRSLRLGHFVRVGQGVTEMYYGPTEIVSQHTLSGEAAEGVGEALVIEIAPRGGAQQRKRRRQEVEGSRREIQRRVAMGPVRAGVEADDGGRWAVRCIRAVRRHEGRRGRPLDVLVEWEGEDSDGDLWEESWVSVTELTPDLRAEARQLEIELFGPRRSTAAEARRRADASRRADRRAAAAQRQERERGAQQWRARLRDRAPTPAGTAPSSGEDR